MDETTGLGDHWRMVKKRRRTRKPPRKPRELHLGQWIIRLGRKAVEVAKATGIGPSYMSLIISGQRKKIDPHILLDISEELGVTVNDLYKPPPSAQVVAKIGKMRPDQMAALANLTDLLDKE